MSDLIASAMITGTLAALPGETPGTAPIAERVATAEPVATGGDWATMLWDDPVTLRPYVVRVLMRRFGHSAARAEELTAIAERDGRAAVAHGAREEQEMHVAGLHADGLVATLERMPGGAS